MKPLLIAFILWISAAAVLYALILWEPIYAMTYYLSSLFLTMVKIQEYTGPADMPKALIEDFYGWTTLVVLLTFIPITFVFMGDE